MEKFHDKQISLQAKIANSFQNFKSKGKENMTEGYAESRLAGLKRNYTSFQVNHEKIMHLQELDKKHTYFRSKLYDLVEDSFYDHGDFLDFLKTFKAKVSLKMLLPPLPHFQSLPNLQMFCFNLYQK